MPARQVAHYPGENPFAYRNDQASLFERWQEYTRGYQSTFGVTPTQKRLGGDNSAADSFDDRLVENQELFLLERETQALLEPSLTRVDNVLTERRL